MKTILIALMALLIVATGCQEKQSTVTDVMPVDVLDGSTGALAKSGDIETTTISGVSMLADYYDDEEQIVLLVTIDFSTYPTSPELFNIKLYQPGGPDLAVDAEYNLYPGISRIVAAVVVPLDAGSPVPLTGGSAKYAAQIWAYGNVTFISAWIATPTLNGHF